jgi:hypothetical protein
MLRSRFTAGGSEATVLKRKGKSFRGRCSFCGTEIVLTSQ